MRILCPETFVDANQITAIGTYGRLVQVTTGLEPPFGYFAESSARTWGRQPLQLAARIQPRSQPARHQGTTYPRLTHGAERAGVLHPIATATPAVAHIMAPLTARERAATDMDTRHREAPVKHGKHAAHNFPAYRQYLANAPRTRQPAAPRGTAGLRHATPAHAAPVARQRAAAVIHRDLTVVVSVTDVSLRNVVRS